jgi:hypothetical protein
MNPRFDIMVEIGGQRYYIDTYSYDPITLNYSIADVNTITSRDASYSKTITVPDTSNNRAVFQFISDLSVQSFFNANKKVRCWVLVNTVVVLEGNLQLNQVNPNLSTGVTEYNLTIFSDLQDFYTALGENYIVGNTTNIDPNTGTSTDDIDFSDLDHIWDLDNITNSWNYDYNWGYYYPLIDYGNGWNLNEINGGPYVLPNGMTATSATGGTGTAGFTGSNIYPTQVDIVDMYPATYVKQIFDRMFEHTGFKYQSDFLNGDISKNLIIPFNGVNMTTGQIATNKEFEVAIEGTYSFATSSYISSTYSIAKAGILSSTYYVWQYKTSTNRVPYNFVISDVNGYYDLVNYDYQNTQPPYTFNQSFVVNVDLTFYNTTFNNFGFPNENYVPLYTDITVNFWRDFGGTTASQIFDSQVVYNNIPSAPTVLYTDGNTGIVTLRGYTASLTLGLGIQVLGTTAVGSWKSTTVVGSVQSKFLNFLNYPNTSYQPILPNEKVWVEVIHNQLNFFNLDSFGTNPFNLGQATFPTNKIGWDGGVLRFNDYNNGLNKNGNLFANIFNEAVVPGGFIDYNSVIPQKFKQKDFFYNIVEMFNLYIEPSKTDPYTLIIEPRELFYAKGKVLDWSSKIDINDAGQEQILASSDSQFKKIILTYSDATDYLNNFYKQQYNQTYGYFEYDIDNDFSTDVQTIQPTFAPTAITYIPGSIDQTTGFIIPRITKDNGSYNNINGGRLSNSTNPTTIMLKYFNPGIQVGNYGYGLLQIQNQVERWFIAGISPVIAQYGQVNPGATVSCYPYAGHFDNPYKPTVDINFGVANAYFYKPATVTDNNLSTYYDSMLNELYSQDSRLLTLSMYLTEVDLYNFSFSDKIYLFFNGSGQYYRVNKISNYDPGQNLTCQVEFIKIINL